MDPSGRSAWLAGLGHLRLDDVRFVAINGQPFYGTTKLMKAAGAQHAEPISLGRLRRSIQLPSSAATRAVSRAPS